MADRPHRICRPPAAAGAQQAGRGERGWDGRRRGSGRGEDVSAEVSSLLCGSHFAIRAVPGRSVFLSFLGTGREGGERGKTRKRRGVSSLLME